MWRSKFQLPYVGIPARWDELGEGADHARNQVIAEQGPAALLALPGDTDTQNARAIARLHDIPVIE